jgi:hypothetical protein
MIRGDPVCKILEIPLLRIAATSNLGPAGTRWPEPADHTTVAVATTIAMSAAAAGRR